MSEKLFKSFKTPDGWNARVIINSQDEITYEETIVINPEYGTLRFGDAGNVNPDTGEIDLSRGSRFRKSAMELLLDEHPEWLDD
ncbi:MAG: hypothetical protein U0491_02280 [Candidatus Saccharimonadales bacterium]